MILYVSDKFMERKVLDESGGKFDFRNIASACTWNSRIVVYDGNAGEFRSAFIRTSESTRLSTFVTISIQVRNMCVVHIIYTNCLQPFAIRTTIDTFYLTFQFLFSAA